MLDNHPVPANNFLNPPEVDAYIEDLVNDKRAFKFLKLQDQALKHVQRKVSRCLGPLAEIWEELDGAQEGDKSGKSIQEVTELVEKTILMIGQVNTACLYERRLTWLAKLFKSVANAKTIIKDHNDEFDKEVKLFGADFYSVLDRKAKNRKRAREMAKEMRPAKRARPFQEGPSGGTSISSKPRGSTTWRANKPGQQKGDKPAFKTSKANKPFKARYVLPSKHRLKYLHDTRNDHFSRQKSKVRSLQSPYSDLSPGFCRIKSKSIPIRGQNCPFYNKLGENNFRPNDIVHSPWHETRFHKTTSPESTCSKSNNIYQGGKFSIRSRNQRNVDKTGSGDCRADSDRKRSIFEYFIHPSQKRWGDKTNFQFEKDERIHTVRTLQNGRVSSCKNNSEARGLHMQNRSQRCLFLCCNKPKSQEISKVQLEGEVGTIQKPPFWSGVRPSYLHKNNEAHNSNLAQNRGSNCDLSRRHVDYESDTGGPDKGQGFLDLDVASFGVGNKLEKVSNESNSDPRISRVSVGLEQHDSFPASSENKQPDQKMSERFTVKPNYNPRTGKFGWVLKCNSGGSNTCSSLHERTSNASNKMFNKISELSEYCRVAQSLQNRNSMVGPKTKRLEWETNSNYEPSFDSRNRCIKRGVGIPLPITKNKNRGALEQRGAKLTHKCSRNESSRNCNQILDQKQGKHSCTSKNGQCDCSHLSKQNGGHQILHSEFNHKGDMGILHVEKDHCYSRIPSRLSEQYSRLGEQECPGSKHKQLETESNNFQPNKQNTGTFQNRPICRPMECSGAPVHQLEERPTSSLSGCFSNNLGKGKESICFSSILHDSQVSIQTPEGGGRTSSGNSCVADSIILPLTVTDDNCKSNSVATTEKSVNVTRGGKSPNDPKWCPEISGMENFRKSQEMLGVSKQTSELLTAAWRQGTQSAYNSCWEHWARWCNQQQTDPFCAPVESVANFLSSLFQKGYEYRTINNYRSAISAFHVGVNGQKMGQISLIKQVMKGAFNSRPPLPRYNETWDVDKVLKHLEGIGENQNLSLKELTFKTLTLMALTSASRVSELQKLDIRFMNVHNDEIVFTITQLTKTRTANNKPLKINFPKLDRDKLDVYSCIIEYIKRTEQFRGEEHQFFISYTKPHKGVKPCTLAGWLKSMIGMAGIDTNVFKAHSTRGASTSKAFKFGLSIGQIMSRANWKSVGTFNRFYNKPVDTQNEFADKVLKIAANV